jgi:RhtB (resistance to homoserine/threonine) family protein
MINFSLIAIATFSHLLAVISPGPDFVMALKNSLTYSRKTGIYTAIGFGLGIGIHIFYSFAGLAVIISQSEIVFKIIKYLGASYLFYIGFLSILEKNNAFKINKTKHLADISAIKAIQIGFLTNVLNPKASLFFLSLFTFILKSNPSTITILIISIIMILNTVIWFSLVAYFFNIHIIQKQYSHYQNYIGKGLGILLILIALLLVFQ